MVARMHEEKRPYNFGAGPTMLPLEVLERIQKELFDWRSGMSIMEFSHRTPEFMELAFQSEQDLRKLLEIPDDFAVLFMHGGARAQFSAIPLNFTALQGQAGYLNSGFWSEKAAEEARRFTDVVVLAEDPTKEYNAIPDEKTWKSPQGLFYVHYADNETIQGVEFPEVPKKYSGLLACDMTSNLGTRKVDWQHYVLVYAATQKIFGIAGLCIVIVRRDWLGRGRKQIPSILDYTVLEASKSLYNTPPIFPWYVTALCLQWLLKEGGIPKMESLARQKADLFYTYIDSTDFYQTKVLPAHRSRINIPFYLKEERLTSLFLTESKARGLLQLAGHKVVGGLRASFYTAMPVHGVQLLVEFMQDFERRYG